MLKNTLFKAAPNLLFLLKCLYTLFDLRVFRWPRKLWHYSKFKEVQIQKNQEELLNSLRNKLNQGEPIKIAFLVSDRAKWNAESLVRELKKFDFFSCDIIYFPKSRYHNIQGLTDREEMNRDILFFKSLGLNVIEWNQQGATKAPFDLIFIQQPWGRTQDLPYQLRKNCLCLYMHYGYLVTHNPDLHLGLPKFHPYLWRILVQHQAHSELIEKNAPALKSRMWTIGYPKLDPLRQRQVSESKLESPYWKGGAEQKRVIYAPHHSLGRLNPVRLSTFDWSALPILELMESSQGLSWIYKPHPQLKFTAVSSGLFSPQDYQAYISKWFDGENSSVFDSGSYLDIFATSDCLITDCGSFLGEYLVTGKPIIRLISRNNPVGLNQVGRLIDEVCYRVTTEAELREVFESVVLNGSDEKKSSRQKLRDQLFPKAETDASRVVKALLRDLNRL